MGTEYAESSPVRPSPAPAVHQATGMLMVQLDTTPTAAFARLRDHAVDAGLPLEVVARDIVERRLSLRDLAQGERPRG